MLLLLLPWRRQRGWNDTAYAYIAQRPSDIDARSDDPLKQCVRSPENWTVCEFIRTPVDPATCEFACRRQPLLRLSCRFPGWPATFRLPICGLVFQTFSSLRRQWVLFSLCTNVQRLALSTSLAWPTMQIYRYRYWYYKKLSYRLGTARRYNLPKIA